MGNAKDWAHTLKQTNDAKQAAADRDTQRTAMIRDIIAEQMPTVWEDLLKEFTEHCDAYNEQFNPERKLSLHRTGAYIFMIRPDAMEEIVSGHYSPDAKQVILSTRGGKKIYKPYVYEVGAGEIRLSPLGANAPMNLDSIAQKTIQDGLERAGFIHP